MPYQGIFHKKMAIFRLFSARSQFLRFSCRKRFFPSFYYIYKYIRHLVRMKKTALHISGQKGWGQQDFLQICHSDILLSVLTKRALRPYLHITL